VPYIVKRTGISPTIKVNAITKEQRALLVDTLKGLTLEIKCFRHLNEAIITQGGIKTSEINPSTMESKRIKGLYFAGEVIDVDAYTGGYNLQIAFSTGALAGTHSAWGE
jgi:predicted flavoprotein YhiN